MLYPYNPHLPRQKYYLTEEGKLFLKMIYPLSVFPTSWDSAFTSTTEYMNIINDYRSTLNKFIEIWILLKETILIS